MNPNENHDKRVSRTLNNSSQTVSRETAQMRLALEFAKEVTRNRHDIKDELGFACKQIEFAKSAHYSVDNDGANQQAPGVPLAREVARCWGHVRYGFQITYDDDEKVQLLGWAWDLTSGAYAESADVFPKKDVRVTAGGQRMSFDLTKDEANWRGNVNKRGAIAERSALLKVLPRWLVDEGLRACLATEKADTERNLSASRDGMLAAFKSIGVNRDQLIARLQVTLENVTAEDIVSMRGVFASIRDGHAKIADYFPPAGLDEIAPKAKKKKAKKHKLAGKPKPDPQPVVVTSNSKEPAASSKAVPVDRNDEAGSLAAFLNAEEAEVRKPVNSGDGLLDALLEHETGKE